MSPNQSVHKSKCAEQRCEPFESSVFVGDGDEWFVVDYREDAAVKGVGDDASSRRPIKHLLTMHFAKLANLIANSFMPGLAHLRLMTVT